MEGLGELQLPHLRVMLLLFAGLACLAAYWLRAGHIDNPLFAPSLFKTRTFAVGILGNLFARLGSGALPFLVPLLLQVALGYSPSQAGMSIRRIRCCWACWRLPGRSTRCNSPR